MVNKGMLQSYNSDTQKKLSIFRRRILISFFFFIHSSVFFLIIRPKHNLCKINYGELNIAGYTRYWANALLNKQNK